MRWSSLTGRASHAVRPDAETRACRPHLGCGEGAWRPGYAKHTATIVGHEVRQNMAEASRMESSLSPQIDKLAKKMAKDPHSKVLLQHAEEYGKAGPFN